VSGFPLIGWAKPVPVTAANLRSPRRDFAAVAFAGPLSNLLLAFVFASVLAFVPEQHISDRTFDVLQKTVVTNVLLAVFNMIPLPPLDGGNILAGIVPESVAQMIDRTRPYGFIVLYVLMLSGALTAIMTPVILLVLRWLPK
jgi:Zn-dependent protease